MADVKGRICESPGCTSPANLQCPTCIKLNLGNSYFCTQECFKKNWKTHKVLHKKIDSETKISNDSSKVNNHVQHHNCECEFNPWPGYLFTGPLRPYPKSEKREVPPHIMRPDYADHPDGVVNYEKIYVCYLYDTRMMSVNHTDVKSSLVGYPASEMALKRSTQIQVLSPEDIECMRTVCRLAREVLDIAAGAVKIGATTDEIDRIVHEATVERNCYPSPLNYHGFPKSCCTSVNEVICHGIPDKRPLINGDILNIDITCFYNGFHGDLNETFLVGDVDEEGRQLVKTAHECLMLAVNEVKPGVRYRDLGDIIQKHAKAYGCSVTKSYCGHGIHRLFHTAPNVPHYAKNKAVGVMKPGHVFTIEPMINKGTWRDQLWPDDWTVVTVDGLRSAQFEHTLLVTETGVEILTQRPDNEGRPHFVDQL